MMNIGRVVDHAYSARECIAALRDRERYNLVSLDHDMDENSTHQDETGTLVAEYIRLHLLRDKYPDRVVVHSHNEEAAKRMRDIISEVGIRVYLRPYRHPYPGFTGEE